MSDYARIKLATGKLDGEIGPLPAELVGLEDATLADLPAALDPVPKQFKGVGYWSVYVLPLAAFDPRESIATGTYDVEVDRAAHRVTATPELRDLTTDEIAALPPLPVPIEIADWQFATILAEDGIISQAEAEDFCDAGVLPAALDAALDQIPDEAVRRRTRIKVRGAKTYVRTDPATVTLAGILGYDGDEIENIWRRGAAVA